MAIRSATKFDITSPALRQKPNASTKLFASTGASKIPSIGCWTSPSEKMIAEFGKDMLLKISQSCATLPSIYFTARIRINEAFKPNASEPDGTMIIY